MTESLEDNLKKCFAAWRSNPSLSAPYLFSTVVSLFLLALFTAAVIFFLNPMQGLSLTASIMPAINWQLAALDIILFIILLFALALIGSFFQAGAVGMSWKALVTGKTSLDDLVYYGGRKFLGLFLANLVIYIPVILVGIIFALVQFIFPGDFVSILFLLVGVLLAMVPYAIVIGDMGVFKSIGHSCDFFKENKLQTVLLYVFTYYFSLFATYWLILACIVVFSSSLLFIPDLNAVTSVSDLITWIMPAIPVFALAALLAFIVFILVSACILSPLVTLFWAELYLSNTKHKKTTTKND